MNMDYVPHVAEDLHNFSATLKKNSSELTMKNKSVMFFTRSGFLSTASIITTLLVLVLGMTEMFGRSDYAAWLVPLAIFIGLVSSSLMAYGSVKTELAEWESDYQDANSFLESYPELMVLVKRYDELKSENSIGYDEKKNRTTILNDEYNSYINNLNTLNENKFKKQLDNEIKANTVGRITLQASEQSVTEGFLIQDKIHDRNTSN